MKMAKKTNKKTRVSAKNAFSSVKKSAAKAKLGTKKTRVVARERLRDLSDQMAGTKEHEAVTPEAPRITNDTVAERREEILGEARRYILPLHSRRRVVVISVSIVTGLLAAVILATGLLLYRFQSTSSLTYNIAKLIPFPVARVDGDFVPYENYLFELRSTIYYYRNHGQEGLDIDSEEGEELLLNNKQRILEKIQIDALAQKIARENDIVITDTEIEDAVQSFADKLGSTGANNEESTLSGVLKLIYDWELDDLEKVVKLQLTYQKVSPIIDEESTETIEAAYSALESGDSFRDVVAKYSDDKTSSSTGGKIGEISTNSTDWEKYIIDKIFALEVGEYSEVIVSPRGQHIFKVNKIIDDSTRDVSQIFVAFGDIQQMLQEHLEKVAHRAYIEPR